MSRQADSGIPHSSNSSEPTVYVVDDECAICEAVKTLLESEGFNTACFQTGQTFLDACSISMKGCILLDLCLPDYSGLEIQKMLAEREVNLPVIFLTGHGSIPSSSEAFRTGAVDFLEKPFNSDTLLQRVSEALAADEACRTRNSHQRELDERYGKLSEREREVLQFVVKGYSSKEMAKEMGISHRTVEIYRAHIMRKMHCETLVELMRLVAPLIDDNGEVH